MISKSSKLALAFAVVGALTAPVVAAPHVSIADARKIALARVPGTIVHEKLKKAKKKGHDHYNIKITPRDHKDLVKKVEIDAETGAILEVSNVKPKHNDD